jgi:hypothetical protein
VRPIAQDEKQARNISLTLVQMKKIRHIVVVIKRDKN